MHCLPLTLTFRILSHWSILSTDVFYFGYRTCTYNNNNERMYVIYVTNYIIVFINIEYWLWLMNHTVTTVTVTQTSGLQTISAKFSMRGRNDNHNSGSNQCIHQCKPPATKPTAPTTTPATTTRTTKTTMTATTTVTIMTMILYGMNRSPPTCYQRHHPPVTGHRSEWHGLNIFQ